MFSRKLRRGKVFEKYLCTNWITGLYKKLKKTSKNNSLNYLIKEKKRKAHKHHFGQTKTLNSRVSIEKIKWMCWILEYLYKTKETESWCF